MGAAALQDTSVVWPHRAALLVRSLGRRRDRIKTWGQRPLSQQQHPGPKPSWAQGTNRLCLSGRCTEKGVEFLSIKEHMAWSDLSLWGLFLVPTNPTNCGFGFHGQERSSKASPWHGNESRASVSLSKPWSQLWTAKASIKPGALSVVTGFKICKSIFKAK